MDKSEFLKACQESTEQRNASILGRLVGKTLIQKRSEWDCDRRALRTFYDIKQISGVELECEPHKAVILHVANGSPMMFLNMNQFEECICRIDEYGSIQEYLESSGFSHFN